jgi:uncharacterized protein (TIGR00730 family)
MSSKNNTKNSPKKSKKRNTMGMAHRNHEFLESPGARTLRIIGEYHFPLNVFKNYDINNTIVFFGSARIKSSQDCQKSLKKVKSKYGEKHSEYKKAEKELSMSYYHDDACTLAKKVTKWSFSIKDKEKRFYVTTGGGPGIMEAANKGASLAKRPNVGLHINLPFEPDSNPYITPELNFEFNYFFMRKYWFIYLAKAFVIFPGGFGTMDEFFELLTLIQTKKITKKLFIVLYGSEYWKNLINFDFLLECGMISKENLSLFTIKDDIEDVFKYLKENLTKNYL